jgi:hypothetical protein
LNCQNRSYVLADLEKNGEILKDAECFSDFIFVYDKKLKKKRHGLLITGRSVYVYDLKQWKVVFTNELANLKNVSIASKNCTLLSLHFPTGSSDLLIESYRRIDIILYCARGLKEGGLPIFKLKIRKNFKSTKPDDKDDDAPLKDIPTKDLEKAKKDIDTNYLQETIRNSRKAGYMRLLKKGFFGRHHFSEYFFVLSDLGLIYFKKFGDKHAQGFLPLLGGSVKTYPKQAFDHDHVFGIKFAEEETILQGVSKTEVEEWLKLIRDMQEKCLTSKDTIKEIGKIL